MNLNQLKNQPCPRENVSVVALARLKGFAETLEDREGRSRGKEGSALGVDVRLSQFVNKVPHHYQGDSVQDVRSPF